MRIPDEVLSERFDDGVVVVRSDTGAFFELNVVAARIWELICAGDEVRDIEATLVSEFEVDAATASTDVERLLGELTDRGLLAI